MVEKEKFLSQIFEKVILMNLQVVRSPVFENHIFTVSSVFMCVYVSVISMTEKQITAKTSNLMFYICMVGWL